MDYALCMSSRRTIVGFVALALGSAIAMTACGWTECEPCNAKPIPVTGAPSDFTAGPFESAEVSVQSPVSCPMDRLPGDAIMVVGHGTVPLRFGSKRSSEAGVDADGTDAGTTGLNGSEWLRQWVEPRLGAANIVTSPALGPVCDSGSFQAGPWWSFSTSDWKQADQIVVIVADEMRRHDVAGNVVVRIGEQPVLCPAVCTMTGP